ncbi:hypothetical protein PIB30_039326 [Stylosanthes scabra]|uniref:Uncharacterized protein n=1 Tax=Stylosanthes scabra TaxID=79078 RepID=A0ABU6REE0_9FABA|nr:hypothetical protein [Stylosanthes scabra]
MGNSPPSSLRPYNGDQSYSVQLSDYVTIHFTEKKVSTGLQLDNKTYRELWEMSYKVHNSTYNFVLTRVKDTYDKDYVQITTKYILVSDSNKLELHDMNSVTVHRDEVGALSYNMPSYSPRKTFGYSYKAFVRDRIKNTITNAWGGITETYIELNEHGRMRFMFVMEWKKRSNKSDGKPYMLSVTHYYASLENGKDVGLSIQVKRIKAASSGSLDFAVDGPHLHPANALFYMYDEIIRSRKPISCPHCANNIIQNLRMSYPSESEDSDIDTAVLPLCRSQNGGGRGRSILENGGTVRGNYNGNLSIRNFILNRK